MEAYSGESDRNGKSSYLIEKMGDKRVSGWCCLIRNPVFEITYTGFANINAFRWWCNKVDG